MSRYTESSQDPVKFSFSREKELRNMFDQDKTTVSVLGDNIFPLFYQVYAVNTADPVKMNWKLNWKDATIARKFTTVAEDVRRKTGRKDTKTRAKVNLKPRINFVYVSSK